MAERRYAVISEITSYAAKGDSGTALLSAALVKGAGLEGDMRADGGERQLCLLSREAALWMAAHDIPGLCFARFKANLVLDTASGEPFRRLSAGERLRAGEAELEITDAAKRCHDWPGSGCRLRDAGLACLLTSHTMFAKVTRSGRVSVGDPVMLEEDTGAAKPAFSHFDSGGNAIMVDVSAKPQTARTAMAKGSIVMSGECLRAIRGKTAAKGDVLGVARVAGIMAAKKTAGLIPLCHSLSLDSCALDFTLEDGPPCVEATCTVKVTGGTGAEMEAMTGVSIALLTVYDMCKAMDRTMEIGGIRLWEKSGGKSGHFTRAETD